MENNIAEFNKSKIYEKLDFLDKPSDYDLDLPWVIQNQIAATNGIHYADMLGKLHEIPSYNLPVESASSDSIMLDIGSGWGRWLIAGSKKGYIPVGIDLRLEFCETQQKLLKSQDIKGYSIVADLESLPFQENIFDLVWSFSVIQHTHKIRLENCLNTINFILSNTGFTLLEFPNKNGVRNRIIYKDKVNSELDDYNSWDVRYYTIAEYKEIFEKYLHNFSFTNHSFLGIGILPEDIKYVSNKNKIACAVSRVFSKIAELLPYLSRFSDSIYIKSTKNYVSNNNINKVAFIDLHKNDKFSNLNIVGILQCPLSGGELIVDESRTKIISPKAGVFYPIINDIPIIVKTEAKSL